MPFAENEYIYLVDEHEKKHWLKVSFEMLKIASLGTIDGVRLKDMDDGSSMVLLNAVKNLPKTDAIHKT